LDFLWQDVSHAPFWIGVAQIIGVNVILSGDNAVVIALACMTLPPRQRMWGMILGAGVAVLLRVIFTAVVAQAMTYPYLRLVGGLLLFWVAVKLVIEDEADGGGEGKVESAQTLWRAVRIVVIADIVMSLDNVIAIAAAAETAGASVDLAHAEGMKIALIVFGLATSVPLIVAGSAILMALLERYRILIWAGGALLGWIAGDILSTDPALLGYFGDVMYHWHAWAGRAGALIVVGFGLFKVGRKRRLTVEDVLAGAGLLIWLAADVGIETLIPPEGNLLRWSVRGAIALVLAAGYLALRSGRPIGREEV
jgi:YjbE family integral membrane protein